MPKRTEQPAKSADEELLSLAVKRFKAVVSAESQNRDHMLDDMRFRAASPDDKYQWPDAVRTRRETDAGGQRPCLTINKIPQHVNQVTNDIRQNRPSIKVIPVNEDADEEVAEILNDVIRHIQYNSDADVAYDTCADNQVVAGVGYIRVLTDYQDDDSFDQDIFIRRIRNPLTVYMDPDSIEPDGSDARYCFITEMMSRDDFKAEYPNAPEVDWEYVGRGDDMQLWFAEDQIRIAEYWLVEYKTSKLNLWANGQTSMEGDDLPEGVIPGEAPIRTRPVEARKICCYKIAGNVILNRQDWAGKYIPIARALGNEYDIEGRIIVSGLVRNAKDAQRMYNYWASQEVEMLALAPKAPFVGAAGQFEGFEDQWKTANVVNHAYLEYNPVVDTDTGEQAFPPPQRVAPPMPSAGILQAKMGASDDIKSTTGQYDASLGARGNETSGRAIMARQREGDTGTYHYVDNLGRAIRHVGRIIVDLIPKIYDTPRVVRLIGADEAIDTAQIDPTQQESVKEIRDTAGALKKIYNPSIGKYDVCVTTGPSFTTKRQEAFAAMEQMTQSNPALWQVIGDLMVRNMDWPGADEMAERLKRTIDPKIIEDDDGQEEIPPKIKAFLQETMGHMKATEQQMAAMAQQLQQAQEELADKRHQQKLDAYKAVTDRIKVLDPANLDPALLGDLDADTTQDALTIAPDIGEPPILQAQPTSPPDAGFFTPGENP